MLLHEVSPGVQTSKTVAAALQQQLPPTVKVTQTHPNELSISHTTGPFDGLGFLAAFGYTGKRLRKIADKNNGGNSADASSDGDYGDFDYFDDYDDGWEMACHAAFASIVKKVFTMIPHGWTVSRSICSFERDPRCPYISVSVGLDYARKSRSAKTEWYHITLASAAAKIQREGLIPGTAVRAQLDGYRNRIFLFSANAFKHRRDEVMELARNLQSAPPTAFGSDFVPPEKFKDIVIFKVTLPAEFTKRLDAGSNKLGGIYVSQPIPSSQLEVVYRGQPK